MIQQLVVLKHFNHHTYINRIKIIYINSWHKLNNTHATIIILFIISSYVIYCQLIYISVISFNICIGLTLFIISGGHIHPICLISNMGVSFVVCKVSNTLRATKMFRSNNTFQLFNIGKLFMIFIIAKCFGVNIRYIFI